MLYKKAEMLDPSVYNNMRDVPIEYQKERQKEFQLLEPNLDDFNDDREENLVEQILSLDIQQDSLLTQNYSIQKGYSTKDTHIRNLIHIVFTRYL